MLRKNFLDSPYSLGEARVIYEIASDMAPTASDIGRALDLDAGYLSRVLRNFERRGLVERKVSQKDARQSHLALSPRGRKAFKLLDDLSQRDIGTMLDKLSPTDQSRLIEAMHTIETLLEAIRTPAAKPAPAKQSAAIDCATRRRAISAGSSSATPSSMRRNTNGASRSKACARRSSPTYVNNHDAKRERCWIAEMDGENVGCIFVAKDSDEVARIRLLLVDPKARGLGLGARLTEEAVRFAREAGYKKMTLWTHSVLKAARHIYQKAGFKLMRSEKHKSWGQPVVSEYWDLEF